MTVLDFETYDYLFWSVLGIVLLAMVGHLATFLGLFSENKDQPPVKYGLPIVGVLPFLGDNMFQTVTKWSLDTYGPIFYIKLGSKKILLLNTAETIKEAFQTKCKDTSSRGDTIVFDQENGISFLNNTEKFRNQRQFGMKTLHKFETSGKIRSVINKEGDLFIQHIASLGEKPFDLKPYVYRMSENILATLLLSRRFDYNLEETNVMSLILNVFGPGDEFKKIIAVGFMPWLKDLPPLSWNFSSYKERRKAVGESLRAIVNERKNNFDDQNLKDFADYFIDEQKNGENPVERGFTDVELCSYIEDIGRAGIQSGPVSILWILVCSLQNFECFEKVRKEVDEVIGDKQELFWEDRLKMPYTCAFLDEVWRTCSPLNKTVPHKTDNEIKLGKYTIPANTEVWANLWGSNYDPSVWSEPEKFDPQRFLDSEGNYVKSDDIIPFGVGPRMCLAALLVSQEVLLVFIKIVQNFQFKVHGDLPTALNGIDGVTTYDPRPFKLILEKRKK